MGAVEQRNQQDHGDDCGERADDYRCRIMQKLSDLIRIVEHVSRALLMRTIGDHYRAVSVGDVEDFDR